MLGRVRASFLRRQRSMSEHVGIWPAAIVIDQEGAVVCWQRVVRRFFPIRNRLIDGLSGFPAFANGADQSTQGTTPYRKIRFLDMIVYRLCDTANIRIVQRHVGKLKGLKGRCRYKGCICPWPSTGFPHGAEAPGPATLDVRA